MNKKTKNFYVKKMQKSTIVLCSILVFALSICGCTRKEEEGILKLPLDESVIELETSVSSATDIDAQADVSTSQEPLVDTYHDMIWVHICGAVNNPGVYELPEGSRIYEIVDAAGGFSEDACKDYVNLAQTVSDESRIIIPTAEEVDKGDFFLSDTDVKKSEDKELVNINTADVKELCTLPGIGESRAEAIINYRNKNGGFDTIEKIMEVEGIKSGMYSKIQDKICVK